ncbi:MAG TPA: hypothetical protein VKT77_02200, partial [Chthonomonadaceae bacterium]|nr:hypothetical protein [Chthonomonadaceae bacterium]
PRSFGPAHWMAVGGGAVAALALVVFTAGSLLRGAHPAVGGPADTVTLTDISKLDLPGKIAARQKDVDRFTAQGKSLDTQIAQLQSQKAAAAQEAGAAQQATAAQMATYNQAKAKRDAAQARYDGAKEREARARAALNGGGGVDRAAIDSEIAQCKARLESLKAQPDIDQGDPGESNADKLRTAQEAVTELQQTLHETKVQRANLFTRAGLATGEERTSINSAIDGADAEIKRLTQQLSSANAALAALRHPNGNSKGGKAHGGSKQAEMHKINLRIAELKRRHDAPVPDRGKLQADLDQAAGAVAAARAALDLCPVPARPGASPAQARLDQITLKLAEALHTQKGVKDKLAQAGAELKQFQSMQKLSQK